MILCSYLNLFPVDLVFLLILRCQWFHYSSDYGVTPNWVYDVAASSHSIHFLPCIQLLFIESWKWQSSIYFLSDHDLHSKFAFRNVAALLTINQASQIDVHWRVQIICWYFTYQSFFHAHQIVVRIITNTLLVFHLLFPVEITTVNEYAVHSYE